MAVRKHRMVTCPTCAGDSVFDVSNPFRPFCSERCKNIDFGAWADEAFRLAANDHPESDHDQETGPGQPSEPPLQ